jgi:hypothetical protein
MLVQITNKRRWETLHNMSKVMVPFGSQRFDKLLV